ASKPPSTASKWPSTPWPKSSDCGSASSGILTWTHEGKGYDPEVVIGALIFNFTNSGASLADAERLDEDEALKSLLEIKKHARQLKACF
ncbi:MAG: hypothetical protein ACLFSZ_10740, partial [Puniceicoccaceae bacterium]